ncbi:hypothetical protein ACVWWQ_002956 [Rhodanobacter sp. TND4EL1]
MDKKWIVRGSSLALAGFFMATMVSAAEPQAAAQAASVTVQGVQVAISPTGQLVAPTAEQRASLSRAMLQQSAAASTKIGALGQDAAPRNEAEARATFRTIKLRNGHTAVGMALPENLMSSLVAERKADGSLSIHHAGDTPNASTAVEVTK